MKQVTFSDNYEIQTILFLVTIIFCNYAYSILFGNILEYKIFFLGNINSCEQYYT